MVREAGAEFVIIGHSERRTLFGETDAAVNRKTMAAFGVGLVPIVCIGETLIHELGHYFGLSEEEIEEIEERYWRGPGEADETEDVDDPKA